MKYWDKKKIEDIYDTIAYAVEDLNYIQREGLIRMIKQQPVEKIWNTPDKWAKIRETVWQHVDYTYLWKMLPEGEKEPHYTDHRRIAYYDNETHEFFRSTFLDTFVDEAVPIKFPYYPVEWEWNVYVDLVGKDVDCEDPETWDAFRITNMCSKYGVQHPMMTGFAVEMKNGGVVKRIKSDDWKVWYLHWKKQLEGSK